MDSRKHSGFTLTEVCVAATIMTLVIAGVMPLVFMSQRAWASSRLEMETHRQASLAVEKLVFGMPHGTGLRGCSSATVTYDDDDWSVEFTNVDGDTMSFSYYADASNIVYTPGDKVIAESVSSSTLTLSNDTMFVTVAVQGTYRGEIGISTSTTQVAFRNQW